MFEKLKALLFGAKVLTEGNIAEAVREVRLALLDADVGYGVVSDVIRRIKEKAIGGEVVKGVTAGDQFIKIVHEELVALMGHDEGEMRLQAPQTRIVLCGLQGAGKTTQAVKLAKWLQVKQGKKALVVALDLQRPAAVLQLKKLGDSAGVQVFIGDGKDPVAIAKQAMKEAHDVVIFDTAGRLHIDEALMNELLAIKKVVDPQEVLFVANSAGGQDAVRVAKEFDEKMGITGSILTMLDGTARAGAALSIREVTKKPLLFEGVGERIEDLRVFNPRSMADRVLGMGDVINLVRKAEELVTKEEGEALKKKLRKAEFTFEDYLQQMQKMRKMGSLKSILKMLPGAPDLPELDEKEFERTEAMIFSMTPGERELRDELVPSRRRRIAKGSGTGIDEVNRLVKGFKQMLVFMKKMPKKSSLFS